MYGAASTGKFWAYLGDSNPSYFELVESMPVDGALLFFFLLCSTVLVSACLQISKCVSRVKGLNQV